VVNDALSNLLSTIAVNEARWSVIKLSSEWGFHSSPNRQIQCHLVVEGCVYLNIGGSSGRASALKVEPGGIILSLGGASFTICESPEQNQILETLPTAPETEVLPWLRIGKNEFKALLIVGTFEVEALRWAPVKRSVPDVIFLPSQTGQMPFWAGALSGIRSLQFALAGQGATAFSRRLSELCVIQVIREYESLTRTGANSSEFGKMNSKVLAAMRHINVRPAHPWTVTSLASMVGMSRSVFSDVFLEEVGEAPIRYLTRVRMAIACQMLKSQNAPIMEIAHQVGYSSNISLIRTFKRFYGITPSAYREYQAVVEQDAHSNFLAAHPAFVFGDESLSPEQK
jgi:AraC-like DNA-binding protein